MRKHKIVAVTPAGRRAYLEILGAYILKDGSIDEWHLWDNCRQESDRAYINDLEKRHAKIKVVRQEKTDGSNSAINQFYQGASNPETFYIKLDDDIVFLPPGFGECLYEAALTEKGAHSYWSPLVVNNAICSWLLKYHSQMQIDVGLMASAACQHGWRSPLFALELHRAFLDALDQAYADKFKVPNFSVSLARFSINCIGFWGEDVQELGQRFCPLGVDDEEWISAVLPSLTGRPGRIIGNITIAHYSFFTQEDSLLKTDILSRYAKRAGIPPVDPPQLRKRTLRQRIRRAMDLRFYSGSSSYFIGPRSRPTGT
jgi:hypothetical protein